VRVLRDVAVIALPGVAPFELGTVCEVFGIDRSDQGVPRFDFAVCGVAPGRVPTSMGFALEVEHGLERLASADLVAVPAYPYDAGLPDGVAGALRDAVARGARVLSVCSGAFALGDAGLLDGRRCTTHWAHAAELARRFPRADVDPAVLYVDDGAVVTSAGTAAGIDACLHVLREEHGASVARVVARRMVVPPHRDGGQAQYVETPVAPTAAETLEDVLTFMAQNLHLDLSVDDLARRAHMSPRTFARRFRAETGTTPLHWLVGQRLLLAQRLLEDGDDAVDVVASKVGFGTAAVLRHHFAKRLGTTPQAYRRTFCRRPA
jgi:transcriptional regulator GlxA family with amidase domain